MVLCLYMHPSKSRAVQHLTLVFIRAWYLDMPQQPAPPGVLEDGSAGDEPSDMVCDTLTPEEDQQLKHVCLSLYDFYFLVNL